ncbi:2-oxo acid dehydrogenase subunit E2 [Candidatus Poriferisodalis sp.]|uniref:dihydrolipoamide acetyltransferase family protein n=1 Tax=Candidatus Poriferisodalis sp. TaxID=3101277 RepID=UPI003B5237DC
MAVEFAMPKLGLTMESGTILRWLVPDRAEVTAGQSVLLVETDKVETEIESSGSGVLAQTGEVGEEYLCGVRIGWLLEADEELPTDPAKAGPPAAAQVQAGGVPAPPGSAQPAVAPAGQASPRPAAAPVRAPGERILASPAAKRIARELGVELAAVAGSGPKGRITERDVRAANAALQAGDPATVGGSTAPGRGPSAPSPAAGSPTHGPVGSVQPPATLAARQLADLLGADLRAVHASAADGRISRADVAAYVRTLLSELSSGAPTPSGRAAESVGETSQQDKPATGAATPDPVPPLTQTPSEQIPLRGMRGVIAERMSASLRSMAQLTLTMDVDMSAVVAERKSLVKVARSGDTDDRADAGEPESGAASTSSVVPGYTDFVVAAVAAALGEHPRVNSQVTDDAVALLPHIHVGLAVALDDGLLVPVVRHADRLSLDDIAAETTRLATGARDGTLGYDDYQGATFTVTALGMFGVDAFTPIINSPNTAILGIGRIREDTVWSDGNPAARPTLTLSLTWDHRAFDGAPAARFAGAVRDWLESR